MVEKVFPFEQVADAHKLMESNGNVGKIILEMVPEDVGVGKDEL